MADHASDDLVCSPKRHTLADEIVRGSGGIQKSSGRRLPHTLGIKLNSSNEIGGDAQRRSDGISSGEQRLLRFLKIAVIRQRQAFERGEQVHLRRDASS